MLLINTLPAIPFHAGVQDLARPFPLLLFGDGRLIDAAGTTILLLDVDLPSPIGCCRRLWGIGHQEGPAVKQLVQVDILKQLLRLLLVIYGLILISLLVFIIVLLILLDLLLIFLGRRKLLQIIIKELFGHDVYGDLWLLKALSHFVFLKWLSLGEHRYVTTRCMVAEAGLPCAILFLRPLRGGNLRGHLLALGVEVA
jgi:hypothetical protein